MTKGIENHHRRRTEVIAKAAEITIQIDMLDVDHALRHQDDDAVENEDRARHQTSEDVDVADRRLIDNQLEGMISSRGQKRRARQLHLQETNQRHKR